MPKLRIRRLTAIGIAATCALAAPALAQNDKMTPVPTPEQPLGLPLDVSIPRPVAAS